LKDERMMKIEFSSIKSQIFILDSLGDVCLFSLTEGQVLAKYTGLKLIK
jgi:hypothetical protein